MARRKRPRKSRIKPHVHVDRFARKAAAAQQVTRELLAQPKPVPVPDENPTPPPSEDTDLEEAV